MASFYRRCHFCFQSPADKFSVLVSYKMHSPLGRGELWDINFLAMKYLVTMLSVLVLAGCQSSTSSSEDNTVADDVHSEIDTLHNSQNSLDWAGEYRGVFPCKDCDSIVMEVSLQYDNTFVLKSTHEGTSNVVEDQGEIKWEDDPTYVHLTGSQVDYHFKLGENYLTYLVDKADMPDDAALEDYQLKKEMPFAE